MSVWKYKQLSPLMAVKRSTLFNTDELNELAERNLNYFISKLLDSPYRKELDLMYTQNASISNLEDVFLVHFNNLLHQIAGLAPESVAHLLLVYVKKFEIDTLKALMTLKHAGLEPEEVWNHVTPVGRLDKERCEQIIEKAEDISSLIMYIMDLDYSYVIYGKLPEFKETGLLYTLESELNKYYYSELWDASLNLRGLDRKIAQDVVGLEIMANNIKVILRYINAGFKRETIRDSLVFVPGVIDYPVMEVVVEKKSVWDAVDALAEVSEGLGQDYVYLFKSIKESYKESRSVYPLENVIDKSVLDSSQLMVKRYTPYFNIASLIAFVTMKWYEVRNLKAILHGVTNNLPSSVIKQQLILSG